MPYRLLPTASCLLPTAYRLLPTAYRLPPTAYRLPPTAYRLRGQRPSARDPDGRARRGIRVPFRRELRVQVLAHVDRAGHRVAGQRAGEDERHGAPRPPFHAPKLHLIAFDCSFHVAHREFTLMRSTDPVAVLFDEQRVIPLAAEELD